MPALPRGSSRRPEVFVDGSEGSGIVPAIPEQQARATLAEAVFPFYIVHQTVILVVGYWLLPPPTGPLARFAILVTATAAGCWAFYATGRRIPWLRPLIGLMSITA